MKAKVFLILVCSILSFTGCKSDPTDEICLTSSCFAVPSVWFKLNFKDTVTGRDLIFDNSSTYNSTNDVHIYSTRLKKAISVSTDSTATHPHFLFAVTGSDKLLIWLSGMKKDTLTIETEYIRKDCCGGLDITRLRLNQADVSFSNEVLNSIVINK